MTFTLTDGELKAAPDLNTDVVLGVPGRLIEALIDIIRVLAAELGVDPKRISVVRGTTATAPWDPGIGGSKGTLLLGQAAIDGVGVRPSAGARQVAPQLV